MQCVVKIDTRAFSESTLALTLTLTLTLTLALVLEWSGRDASARFTMSCSAPPMPKSRCKNTMWNAVAGLFLLTTPLVTSASLTISLDVMVGFHAEAPRGPCLACVVKKAASKYCGRGRGRGRGGKEAGCHHRRRQSSSFVFVQEPSRVR